MNLLASRLMMLSSEQRNGRAQRRFLPDVNGRTQICRDVIWVT